MKNKIKNTVLGIFIVLAFILAVILVLPPILGWKNLVVLSDSMEPSIHKNELVCVKPCLVSEVSEDDVITFLDRHGNYTTHRVCKVEDGTIITKGDANLIQDAWTVDASHLVGKVIFHVPYLGRLIRILQR